MAYIVDLNRNIVRYKFEENVTAFAAGTLPYTGLGCSVVTIFIQVAMDWRLATSLV